MEAACECQSLHYGFDLDDEYGNSLQRAEEEEERVDVVFEQFLELETKDRLMDFYMGGVYTQSIFDVYSKYVSKFIHNIYEVQKVLDLFKQYSRLDKVLLVDIPNEYTVCGDSDPLDKMTYDFCWDIVKNTIGIAVCYNYEDSFAEPFGSLFECCVSFESNRGGTSRFICIRGVNKYMAVVYLLQESVYEKKHFIEHNFNCICDAIKSISNLHKEDTVWTDSSDFEKSLTQIS